MTTKNYYDLVPDKNGWRTLSNGNRFKIGDDAKIGNYAKIGDGVEIGDDAKIGNYAKIGNDATIGNYAKIGNDATIGNYAKIGIDATIGNYAKIGDGVEIGYYATIGNDATIGNYAKIGNYATIGNYAKIGDNQTTEELNRYFISIYPKKSIFWKWVTPKFMSPCWGASTPIEYTIGKTLTEPNAIMSDKQCDVGLHVFRPGIRPEFVGLCDVGHTFICLEVEVNQEDICFGGLPGNDMKLRVKKLKVIRKI